MRHKYGCSFKHNTIGLEKDEVMQLLKLVLENCVFTFQDKFFKQLHGAAMGSPCSLVVANIYMGVFWRPCIGTMYLNLYLIISNSLIIKVALKSINN